MHCIVLWKILKNIYEGCDAAHFSEWRNPKENVIFAHHFIPNFNIVPLTSAQISDASFFLFYI